VLPLEGVRVVELSTMITASLATMMLAEQGASAIKIEPVERGDPMRYIGSSKGGMSGLFASCNRGKRALALNLKAEEGAAIARRLIADADVLLHNFRPGVMDQLGLGSETLREENPRLIYVAISGFGTHGPLREAPAYDPVVQAQAGIAAVQGVETPTFVRNLLCDKITAYTAAQAVSTALYARERSGEGQHIDLSMLDASLAFVFPDGFMNHALLDDDVEQQALLADLLYELTLTRDGALTISAATPAQRLGVYRAIDREDLAADERFSTLEALMSHMVEYRAILEEAFLTFTTDEMVERLRANDVPCAKCLSRDEVLNDAQLAANDTCEIVDHPLMGTLRVVRAPARFGGERLPTAGFCPQHGEHTREILGELGYYAADLERLHGAGVIP
jgi:crotonobetainyl-CoA:carnitine CoA-transferase CaiB-like acyl-CoA transferase